MSLANRIANHAMTIAYDQVLNWFAINFLEEQSKYLGIDFPPVVAILRNRVSIYIACSHPVTHGAWQYLPNVIQVGGLQLAPPKTLTGDLRKFLDSSTEGAVLISFGSSLKPDQMPKEKINIFIQAFKELKMKVIWKWDEDIPNLPDNIMLSSWLPQQDLLAHPNLKVFVTHGGMGSLVEAIYHQAVIVGIPLSNDQKPNMLRAERHGYALHLNWDDLTAETLVSGIRKAMEDKEMSKHLERIHHIYTDREEPPVQKAAWWVEYVCRHQGAKWLRSMGDEVPYYQRHHFDIICLAISTLILFLGLNFYFWRSIYRCCCARKVKTD